MLTAPRPCKAADKALFAPSGRAAAVEEYWFARKLREVARLRAEGHDIVSMAIGGPDRPPHPDVVAALTEAAARPDTHSYQPGTGSPALRRAWAGYYRRCYGVELDPAAEMLPLIGSKEGVLHITMALCNPGDRVLVPDPGYPTYTSATRLAGAEPVPYALDPDRGWEPDFRALEAMDLRGVRMMWANYPNMPTGGRPSVELFTRLVDFCRVHGIVLVHDNPYSHILRQGPALSILAVPGAREVALELNSLSKSHNMAGWRMGLVAGSADAIQAVTRVKTNVDSGMFGPVVTAAITALGLGDDWIEQLNAVYAARRLAAERLMTALGCSFDPAQRGLFLWGRIPDAEPSGEAMAERVLRRHDVFITPGFIFGSGGQRYVRLSLCAPVERIDEATRRILNDDTTTLL